MPRANLPRNHVFKPQAESKQYFRVRRESARSTDNERIPSPRDIQRGEKKRSKSAGLLLSNQQHSCGFQVATLRWNVTVPNRGLPIYQRTTAPHRITPKQTNEGYERRHACQHLSGGGFLLDFLYTNRPQKSTKPRTS